MMLNVQFSLKLTVSLQVVHALGFLLLFLLILMWGQKLLRG